MSKYILSAFADEASPLFYEQIDAMRESGVTHLEMRGVNGRNISSMTREEVRCAKHMLDGAGLSVWSIGSPVGKIKITDPFEPHLDSFKRMLDTAVTCEASVMRIFSFYDVKTDADKAEAIRRLQILAETARGSGVLLCHENEKGIYGDTAENCVEILSAVPELGSVFDPANFIQCGVDPLTAWGMLAEKTTYLHIKDALPSGKVVPAGCGVGNLPTIVADFGARGGKVLSLEPHLTVFKGLADLEEGQKTDIDPYSYPSARDAFRVAADAIRGIVEKIG
ncbi:MAG: sugar phosphate isomerase/epimerase [Clostridia bacterium]|nr:sugar phosphate isomerase/epimerase [Clostridia bacterium]